MVLVVRNYEALNFGAFARVITASFIQSFGQCSWWWYSKSGTVAKFIANLLQMHRCLGFL